MIVIRRSKNQKTMQRWTSNYKRNRIKHLVLVNIKSLHLSQLPKCPDPRLSRLSSHASITAIRPMTTI